MAKKVNKNKAIEKKTPNVSKLYDDTLPTSLKHRGIAEHLKPGIKLHINEDGPVSPYVIKLTREQEKPVQQEKTKEEKIRELAMQLAESIEIDDTPEQEIETLAINIEDIATQLKEPERIIRKEKVKIESVAANQAPVEPADIYADIIDVGDFIDEVNQSVILNDSDLCAEVSADDKEGEYEEPEKHKIFSTETLAERFGRIHLLLPKQARHRAIAAFVTLSFVLVLPIHAMQGIADAQNKEIEITDIGFGAIENLTSATNSAQMERFDTASLDFERAAENFQQAEESLKDMHLAAAALVNIIPETDRTYNTVLSLVKAGKELSNAASDISNAIEELTEMQSIDLVTKLSILKTYITSALPSVQLANNALEDVDVSVVPKDYIDQINLLLTTAPQLENSMSEFLEFADTLSTVLGDNKKMRYLLAFQNNTELRATGGFIGSFAEIDVLNGQIERVYIPEGGTYDVQGQLSEFVAAPEPLRLLNARWEFHDSNWFPDFSSSAKKMLWFYDNAGGPTIDGVIAINATLLPDLLEITGSIQMDEYDREINSENFLFETQKIVEYEYEQYQDPNVEQNAPKQFIGDLAPKILEQLQESDPQTLLAVLDLISTGLSEKDVQMYFKDNDLQSDIESLGWSGNIKQTAGDYLMIVNTNLGGGKTDTVIKQDIDIETQILNDGSAINTVTITKEHTGLSNSLFEGDNNVDYIRVYVPQGSLLLSAEGNFEIPEKSLFETSDIPLYMDEDLALLTSDYQKDLASGTDIWIEQGKTVFGNWIQTKPGEIETVTFTYQTPLVYSSSQPQNIFDIAKSYLGLKELESYTLLVQKQSGVETRTTTWYLDLPQEKTMLWSSHQDITTIGSSIDNSNDQVFTVLIENN